MNYEEVLKDLNELKKIGVNVPVKASSIALIECAKPENAHMSVEEMADMCIMLALDGSLKVDL